MITAPPYARTLLSKNGTWKESKLYYKCICGHWGHVSELLCVKEERVLWCPKCLTGIVGRCPMSINLSKMSRKN